MKKSKINQAFGKLVVRMRKEIGISQLSLSADIGSDAKYISDVELGKRNISLNFAARIARYFKVPLGDLLQEASDLSKTL